MVRKGDTVIVIAGKERGKTGKVLRIVSEGQRAIVEKLNMVKRHTRPNQQNRQGGIIEKASSIHVSNLMPYCEQSKKGSRVRHEVDSKGQKHRVYVSSGARIGK